MLTQTLRRLEDAGLVVRTSHPQVPPRVDYALTDLGWSLSPLVRALDDWVEAHAKTIVLGSAVEAAREIASPGN